MPRFVIYGGDDTRRFADAESSSDDDAEGVSE